MTMETTINYYYYYYINDGDDYNDNHNTSYLYSVDYDDDKLMTNLVNQVK